MFSNFARNSGKKKILSVKVLGKVGITFFFFEKFFFENFYLFFLRKFFGKFSGFFFHKIFWVRDYPGVIGYWV